MSGLDVVRWCMFFRCWFRGLFSVRVVAEFLVCSLGVVSKDFVYEGFPNWDLLQAEKSASVL